MIKIIEAEKEEFERQVNGCEDKFFPVPETHRVLEYGGKIIYSVVLTDEDDDEDDEKAQNTQEVNSK